jgi:hypothetical protein
MTDVAHIKAPPEPVPPIPPAPAAPAEIDATPPEAGAPAGQVAERVLPEIEHAIGATRQRILDEFLDSDSAELSMSEIKRALPTVPPGTIESCVKREFDAGRLMRISPGVYRLAPPKPPEPPKPLQPVRSVGTTGEQWFAWLEEWKATGQWKGLGNPPDQSGHLVPMDAIVKYGERVRKRQERQRQREEADEKLRDQLLAETGGNYMCGARIDDLDDMTTIRLMLQVVPMQHILIGLKRTVDRRIDPRAAPISSWRDERFLRAVARDYALEVLIPSMVAAWRAAGMEQQKPAEASAPRPLSSPGKRTGELSAAASRGAGRQPGGDGGGSPRQ